VTERLRRYGVELALVAVAAVWGGTFVMVKDAVARYPIYAFLGWRFAIAVLAFLVLFPRTFSRFKPGTVRVGVLAGAFLTAGYVFQTWGLQGTSASKAAFITGMFVVITPLLQFVVLRHPPRPAALGGVTAAVAGLWLLSGASSGGWSAGDTRVLLCAVAYSAHMIVLGGAGRDHDSRALTLVQLAVVGVACGGIALVFEHPALPPDSAVWIALAVTGVLASAVAFAVQTYAQRHLSPTRTALILIMEPVFGGVFGYLLAGDRLGTRGWIGAGLIFAGMVLSEVIGALKIGGGRGAVLEPTLEGPAVPLLEPGGEAEG
jgi:drug/metabolite transporter (DMT)-like permease